jgi:hypothetical protein
LTSATAVLVVVIATVGEHAIRSLTRPSALAAPRPDTIDERQRLRDVVALPAGQ